LGPLAFTLQVSCRSPVFLSYLYHIELELELGSREASEFEFEFDGIAKGARYNYRRRARSGMSWVGAAEAVAAASERMAAPQLFAAEGEILAERARVLNVGLEGLMLAGAFAGAAAAHASGSPWTGLAGGVLAGMALAALFGAAVVYAGASQVVAGLAIILLALGLTGVLYHAAERVGATSLPSTPAPPGGGPAFRDLAVPGLAAIPILGSALSHRSALLFCFGTARPPASLALPYRRAG
jgi:simple sugar transport system permease protein